MFTCRSPTNQPSDQPETCHVVRVLSIAIDVDDHISQSISRLASTRVSGAYELPTCPVCLERMDAAVTGLVTVPCSHTFHCACLSKWGDSRQASTLPSCAFHIDVHVRNPVGVPSVGTLRPFSRRTLPHRTRHEPHVHFPSLQLPPPPSAPTAPTAGARRTSGSVLSAETSAAVATVGRTRMHTTSRPHTSTRWSSRPNASGTTPGTATSTDSSRTKPTASSSSFPPRPQRLARAAKPPEVALRPQTPSQRRRSRRSGLNTRISSRHS